MRPGNNAGNKNVIRWGRKVSVELLPDNKSVRATCPECKAALTTYEWKNAPPIERKDVVVANNRFAKVHYYLLKCAGCGRGGISSVGLVIHNSNRGTITSHHLLEFSPRSIDRFDLPADLPSDLASEFREAEIVASVGAWRAASAMMRSTLEKALKHSGYSKGSLKALIDEAAQDGAITAARSVRAHEDIRVLGNDVLHDDWRSISEEEFELAHRYTQRILEDLYDDRASVLKLLAAKNRTPIDAPPKP